MQEINSPGIVKIELGIKNKLKSALYLTDENGTVIMVEQFTTTANPGDKLVWQLDNSGELMSIEGIEIVNHESTGNYFPAGFTFNATKTECYGVLAAYANGTINIIYKYKDGSIVKVYPYVEVRKKG